MVYYIKTTLCSVAKINKGKCFPFMVLKLKYHLWSQQDGSEGKDTCQQTR